MQQTHAKRISARCGRHRLQVVMLTCLTFGCAATPPASDDSALLLVSLSDGSIVGQRISTDAEICVKSNASPATTCLSRGLPLMDTTGQIIIGYHMEQTEIELFAH
jgi:hypothetical protein